MVDKQLLNRLNVAQYMLSVRERQVDVALKEYCESIELFKLAKNIYEKVRTEFEVESTCLKLQEEWQKT